LTGGILLAHGANPNLPEPGIAPQGHALYAAVAEGHLAIAEVLLEAGAHVNPSVESSADALSRAISKGDEPAIRLLCSRGAARAANEASQLVARAIERFKKDGPAVRTTLAWERHVVAGTLRVPWQGSPNPNTRPESQPQFRRDMRRTLARRLQPRHSESACYLVTWNDSIVTSCGWPFVGGRPLISQKFIRGCIRCCDTFGPE